MYLLFAQQSSELRTWAVLASVFVFGAAIGSFLNVVIYRVPRGLSIVRPGSRCPACDHAIRWYDNVPVLSWLLLRGRCRDCGAAISWRYPAVEAAVGGMFVVVASFNGMRWSFVWHIVDRGGLSWESGQDIAAYWLSGLVKATVLCSLLAAALIASDGHRPRARLFVGAVVVAFAVRLAKRWMITGESEFTLVWPLLLSRGTTGPWFDLAQGMAAALLGLVLGLVAAVGVGRGAAAPLAVGLASVGAALGGWAVAAIGVLTAWLIVLATILGCRTSLAVWYGTTAALSLAWIVGWAKWSHHWPDLTARETAGVIGMGLVAALGAAMCLRVLRRSQPRCESATPHPRG